ncbi:MAG TPA: ice-binding family protein [Candidatus Cybelea sp.]|nr:ice-binding family protein [Candidatus Cybelea sp.]
MGHKTIFDGGAIRLSFITNVWHEDAVSAAPGLQDALHGLQRTTSRALGMNATKLLVGILFLAALLSPRRSFAAGPAPIDLGSAAHFAVLATATTTTTGGGIINGDVGLSPAGSQGIPPAQINGTIYNGDAISAQAQVDLNSAIIAASPAQLPGGINAGAELGGQTLVAGVYQSPSGAYSITEVDLTLNGGPNDVWVFQMASSLTVDVGRKVILTGGAQARNIFWQVGSSATLGTSSVFEGTIMAYSSISMNASSTLSGRALAQVGAVTYNGSGGTLPPPAAPFFTTISSTLTNSATVVLSTTPYFQLTLQTSPDLLNWRTIARNTPVTNLWTFTDTSSATSSQRFYQAFLTPYP